MPRLILALPRLLLILATLWFLIAGVWGVDLSAALTALGVTSLVAVAGTFMMGKRYRAETLLEINPRLIYCSITGYGHTGPYKDRAGYDFMIQAMGGMMSVTGEADGLPTKIGVALADVLNARRAVDKVVDLAL